MLERITPRAKVTPIRRPNLALKGDSTIRLEPDVFLSLAYQYARFHTNREKALFRKKARRYCPDGETEAETVAKAVRWAHYHQKDADRFKRMLNSRGIF